MKRDPIGLIRTKAKATPLLTRDEEAALGVRIQAGDERAVAKLVAANLRFAIIAAGRWRGQTPIEDAVQQARIGLTVAARKFDPTRGIRFLTMATPWVYQHVARYGLDDRLIRFPHNHEAERVFTAFRRATSPTVASVAEAGKAPEWYVEALWSVMAGVHAAVETESEAESPEDTALHALTVRRMRERIDAALARLAPRERDVIERRMLHPRTEHLHQIGQSYGMCRESIRKIEAKALAKLRALLADMSEAA